MSLLITIIPPQLLQVLLLDELTTFLDDEDQGGVLRAVRDVTSGDRRVTALWVSATAADGLNAQASKQSQHGLATWCWPASSKP